LRASNFSKGYEVEKSPWPLDKRKFRSQGLLVDLWGVEKSEIDDLKYLFI